MNAKKLRARGRGETGAVLVFVALSMIVLLGIAALAIDVGYLYVVRGELQNAADSGALAGAQGLYDSSGTVVNAGANAVGQTYVLQHIADADKDVVEIADDCDATTAISDPANQLGGLCVERGHWSFQTRTFTPNSSTAPVSLWDVTTTQLDGNTAFINAVRVTTTRKSADGGTRAANEPWLARTFGGIGPVLRASAVAYIGFAGKLKPLEADQPIAICEDALLINGKYTCTVGRMLNSDSKTDPLSGTGGWTDFAQPDQPWPACAGGAASGPGIRDAICTGNPEPLLLGYGMSTTGGVVDNAFRTDFMDGCWRTEPDIDLVNIDGTGGPDGIPDQPWSLTLPVIRCDHNNPTSCSQVVGAVTVDVVWMMRDNPDASDSTNMTPRPGDTPRRMADWFCDPSNPLNTDRACWIDFVSHFQLLAPDGSPAIASKKTIYFKPSCEPHPPAGVTGGENYGILAKIPVLVR